jgi:hypothetical protein
VVCAALRWMVVLTLSLTPAASEAGGRRSEARIHLTAAQRAFARAHYRSALREYEKAYDIVAIPDIAFAMGRCHYALRDWEKAADLFEEFTRTSRNRRKLKLARNLIASARAKLARTGRAPDVVAITDEDAPETDPTPASTPEVVAVAQPDAARGAETLDVHASSAETLDVQELERVSLTPLVGAFVDLGLPDGHGVYTYAGLVVEVPFGRATLMPGLLAEVAPDGRWGGIAGLTLDIAVSEHFGVDFYLEAGTDQAGGDFNNVYMFAAAGIGAGARWGRWSATPFLFLYRGLNYTGYDLGPGIDIGCAL